MNAIAGPSEVLDEWFGAPSSSEFGKPRAFWFKKSEATDAFLRERFGPTVEAALTDALDDWQSSARGTLALILVLDQFTRNIFRDTPRAFAGDAKALHLAQALVRDRADRKLLPVERSFAYLPFEHDESLASQQEAVRLCAELVELGMPDAVNWARKHAEVIERFGRFPHRNQIIGRASTAVELEFLGQPGSRF